MEHVPCVPFSLSLISIRGEALIREGREAKKAIEPSPWLPIASSVHLLPPDKQLKEHHCSSNIHRYTDQTGRSRGFTSS
jgi:hypothetical protein